MKTSLIPLPSQESNYLVYGYSFCAKTTQVLDILPSSMTTFCDMSICDYNYVRYVLDENRFLSCYEGDDYQLIPFIFHNKTRINNQITNLLIHQDRNTC